MRFFRKVLRKRYDSAPVSIIWAWSVSRSSTALQRRALVKTWDHSEKGRFNAESGFMQSPDSNQAVLNQVEGLALRITGEAFSMAIN